MSLASSPNVLPRTNRPTQECWPLMTAARWKEPELSIGTRCGSMDLFGRYKCWQVRDKSPAHIVWEIASKAIFELLEDQHEHLNARNFDFGFHMFMIGRKSASSSPTVLFSCESKQPRRMAMEMVHKKGILTPFPGVLMAESSRVPKPLGTGTEADFTTDFPAVYINGPIRNCGTPILISNVNGLAPRKATIGGTVCILNEYFGLTAGHPLFYKSSMNNDTENDVEFAFYGRDDSSDSLSDEEDCVEMTSMGSFSSNSTLGPASLDLIGYAMTPVSSNRDPIIDSLNINKNPATPEEELTSNTEIIGTLFAASAPEGDMDWALIKLTHTELMAAADCNSSAAEKGLARIAQALVKDANMTADILINKIATKDGFLYPESVASAPADTKVLMRTGSTGRNPSNVLHGELSAVVSFSKPAGCTTFRELWTVRLDNGAFYDGDCGSWVVDAENGNLYGHIVSGYATTEIAHIIPAIRTFRDIERRIWKPVELSTRQKRASFLNRLPGGQANSAEKDMSGKFAITSPGIAQKIQPPKSELGQLNTNIESGLNTSLDLVNPSASRSIARDESRYRLSISGAITRASSLYIAYKALPYHGLRKIVAKLGSLHVVLSAVQNELAFETERLSYTRKEQWEDLISRTKTMLDDLDIELVKYEDLNTKIRPKHRVLHVRLRYMVELDRELLELVEELSIFVTDLTRTFTSRLENLISRCFKIVPVRIRGNSRLIGQFAGSLEEWQILAHLRQELEKIGFSRTTVEKRDEIVQIVRRSLKDIDMGETHIPRGDSELTSNFNIWSNVDTESSDETEDSRAFRLNRTSSIRSTSASALYSPTKSRSGSVSVFTLIAELFRLDSGLLEAADEGDITELLDLITQGANVNKADRWAWTALHIGAYNGQREIVEALIRNGADVKARTVDHETPLQLAILKGHGEVVALIIQAFKDSNVNTLSKSKET